MWIFLVTTKINSRHIILIFSRNFLKFNPIIGGINATQRGKQTSHGDNYKYDESKLSGTQLLNLSENIDIPDC